MVLEKKKTPINQSILEKIFHFMWNCPVCRVSMAFPFQGVILVVAEKENGLMDDQLELSWKFDSIIIEDGKKGKSYDWY